jgi:hypothetical protein
MKRLGIALGLLALASTAQAQDCPTAVTGAVLTPAQQGQNAARDVCQRARDVFSLLAPQLGAAITGGNPVLGQGGTLGGIGKFTVEARVTSVLNGDVPDVTQWPGLQTSAPTSKTLETKPFPVPMPVVDGALGVFKGFPLGVTSVGGVDLLASVAYIPTVDQDEIKITPEANTKFGYGARIGLLGESLVMPGLSFTWMKRDLPTTTITGTGTFTGSSMSFTMADASVKTTSWRVVASKSLIFFGLAAGYGRDSYDESATFSGSATVLTQNTTFAPFDVSSNMTRSNVFANASINLLLLKIVGEIGQVSGGEATPAPFNTFSGGKVDDARTYFSAALRFTW